MDYTNAMMVWDAVSVRITDVRHRLLLRRQAEEVDENSLFLFISGKTGRIIEMCIRDSRKGYGYPDDDYFFLKLFDISRKPYIRNPSSHNFYD